MTNSIHDRGDRPQPISSETHTIARASADLIANLNYGLTTGGALGLGWALGCAALSVLPFGISMLEFDGTLLGVITPHFAPRRYLRQGIGFAAVATPVAFVMACTGAVPMSRPPEKRWWNRPRILTQQQRPGRDQVFRQETISTMLGAVGGAAFSMLRYRRYPRSPLTHAWHVVGTAAFGSFTVAFVHSKIMAIKSIWANVQRLISPWQRMKRWWMEQKKRQAKRTEEWNNSKPARAIERWLMDRREATAKRKKERKGSGLSKRIEKWQRERKERKAKQKKAGKTRMRIFNPFRKL